MKVVVGVILLAITLIYVGGLKFSFNPFVVEFPHWAKIIGWGFIFIGVGFITVNQTNGVYVQGYKEGASLSVDSVLKKIDESYYLVRKDSLDKRLGEELNQIQTETEPK